MLEWLANLLLNPAGIAASWFISKDAAGFIVVQMMIATLVLAAVVAAIVYWQSLLDYLRARRTPRP